MVFRIKNIFFLRNAEFQIYSFKVALSIKITQADITSIQYKKTELHIKGEKQNFEKPY